MRGVADALSQVGISPEPCVYANEFADEVRRQLRTVDGVLVWVNPIENGRDRTILDSLLSQVADEGVFVSAHPNMIQKMGTKEVLVRTRDMSWGGDTHEYTTPQELKEQFPLRLAEGKPRVLKLNRGHSGNGVWKVDLASKRDTIEANDAIKLPLGFDSAVRVRHAARGSVEKIMPLRDFLAQLEPQLSRFGRIVDQAYQARLPDGMVRCYLVRDRVVGFGHQLINALFPAPPGTPPEEAPQPGPRLYYPPTKPEFQGIKSQLEQEWVGDMQKTLGIESASLPIIWDADFLYGPKSATSDDTFVLCEINVSSVFPFPDEALGPLAQETLSRLQNARRSRSVPARH